MLLIDSVEGLGWNSRKAIEFSAEKKNRKFIATFLIFIQTESQNRGSRRLLKDCLFSLRHCKGLKNWQLNIDRES